MQRTHTPAQLRGLAREVLREAGATEENADLVADSLVEANLRGHDSHGVRRLPPYVEYIRSGQLDPAAAPEVMVRGATVTVDGRNGFGQVAARRAVEALAPVAHEFGTATAIVRNANHVGRLGEWVERLAANELIALAFCNAEPTVAPYGGAQRRLGTNPFAWAAANFVLDFSTATMPEGKVAVARTRGESVPDGVLVDADGEPSNDPNAFYDGGALLPFGAHKGSGLSVLIQLVGGVLGQTGVTGDMAPGANGLVLIALAAPDDLTEQAEAFAATLARDGVLVPGEVERRTRARREQAGIEIPAATWSELHQLTGGARA